MQFTQDDEENFELLRNVAEHNAMFWNPEGVQQVREARENTFATSNEDFDDIVKDLFGRDLPKEENQSAESLLASTRKMSQYLDMELDEINFTPIRGT